MRRFLKFFIVFLISVIVLSGCSLSKGIPKQKTVKMPLTSITYQKPVNNNEIAEAYITNKGIVTNISNPKNLIEVKGAQSLTSKTISSKTNLEPKIISIQELPKTNLLTNDEPIKIFKLTVSSSNLIIEEVALNNKLPVQKNNYHKLTAYYIIIFIIIVIGFFLKKIYKSLK